MKKRYRKAGIILLLLIFLVLVVLSRTKILKSLNVWKRILPKKEATVSFYALSRNFRGKLNLACGKIGEKNRIIVTPSGRPSSLVKIFNEKGKLINKFKIKNSQQSFQPAIGNINAGKENEIILAQEKGGSFIYIYKQKKKKFVFSRSFEAFKDQSLGVNLTLGDLNADGREEILVSAGEGGEPQIKIFSLRADLEQGRGVDEKGYELGNFFAFHPRMRHGVRIATLDFDGDGKDEIVALSNLERDTQFKIYKFDKIYSLQSLKRVYGKKTKLPTKIITADLDGDNKLEIITIPEKKVGKSMAVFKDSKKLPPDILGDYLDPEGGFNVVFCDLDGNKKEDVVVNKNSSSVEVFYR